MKLAVCSLLVCLGLIAEISASPKKSRKLSLGEVHDIAIDLANENQRLKQQVETLLKEQAKCQLNQGKRDVGDSGFTFTTSPDEDQVIATGDGVLFQTQIQDATDYDPSASIYTCIDTGLYYFSVNLMYYTAYDTGGSNQHSVGLYKKTTAGQDVALTQSFANNFQGLNFTPGSLSAVVRCSAGEEVNVRGEGPQTALYRQYSSFTGFLIAPDAA